MGKKLALRPSNNSYFDFAQLSHKGWVRSNNEDRLAVREFTSEGNKPPSLVAVLCDGVGGHQGGEAAAQIGVYTVVKSIDESDSLQEPDILLKKSVLNANQAILDASQDKPELEGMASTCITAWIIGWQLYLANLGDSRAYLLRNNKLSQLNHDHTWLEDTIGIELGEKSGVTRNHPLAHVLSRFLGSPQPPEVDLRIKSVNHQTTNEVENQGMKLQSGDRLLLCSDGVTDLLSDTEITDCMDCESARKDAQKLVKRALDKGGHDNTSVIVVHL
jgi:serine/threonine protein phosphatase PrpC